MTVPVCPHQNQYDHFHHEQVTSSQGFPVDKGILSLLEAIWTAGAVTICSCQGDVNLKHGFFGRRHDHPAFIAFEHAADATVAYRIVAEYYQDVVLERVERDHDLSDEHILSFPAVRGRG